MRFNRTSIVALVSITCGVAAIAHCSGDDTIPAITLPDAGSVDSPVNSNCKANETLCGAACIDVSADPKNCGGCGTTCPDKAVCAASKCVPCDLIDNDKDGYNACIDCNDNDANINPGGYDILGNAKDDDCNGLVDDAPLCDTLKMSSGDAGSEAGADGGATDGGGTVPSDSTNPNDLAHAMEMCSPWLTAATITVASDKQHQVASNWGVFVPQAGVSLAALSTGVAADVDDTKPAFIPNVTPQIGTNFNKPSPFPTPLGSVTCYDVKTKSVVSFNDPATIQDLVELKVTLLVPTNAHSYQLDLNYLSTDSPEYVCSVYDDYAMVVVDSTSTKGNILLDSQNHRINVTSEFFTLLAAKDLAGTGMDLPDVPNTAINGGATGWLTLAAPVTPRETITLRFLTFDVNDGIYDSQLITDHFRWSNKPLGCASTTRQNGSSADGGTLPPCGGSDGGIVDASGD